MHPLLETNREAIAALCRRYGVTRLDVFGSILRDDFDAGPERSDVDLFAEFDPGWIGSALGQYFDFKEDLENLFVRKVDVVANRNIRNPYVREEIERSRIPLYAA